MRSLTRLTVLFAAWPSVSHGFSFARDDKFRPSPPVQSTSKSGMIPSRRRSYARKALQIGGSMVPLWLNFGGMAEALAGKGQEGPGATNRVVRTVNGIRHRALGGGDIVVSEMGLGTQRWVSTDFNGPDERLCHQMMDEAILNNGVNLIDTAEQYPIPSGPRNPEGLTEEVIGRWLQKNPGRRKDVVIATKITGGGKHLSSEHHRRL